VIALAAGVVSLALLAAPAHAAAASAEPPAAVDDGQLAIDRAKAAAQRGDHATALAEFTTANALRPSARLQFNIAVCHHQLMIAEAKGTPAHEEHREGAIAAYRAYLEGTPNADDRDEVERIIVDLGGLPPKRPGLRLPRVHPDDPPATPPRLHEVGIPRVEPEPTTATPIGPAQPDPPTQPATPRERELRARVGPFVPLVLGHMGQLSNTDRVAFLPLLGLGARGAALVGRQRRVHVGGELAFYAQPTATRTRHTLFAGHVAATADYALPLGRARRFEIAFGGLLGVLYEQLRWRGDADDAARATCATGRGGEVSARAGLLLGGRIGLIALLGARRNHELALRFGPALAVTGAGTRASPEGGTECDETPFREVGLTSGAGLVTMIDLGYSPRF
jgi:hypothetical protein